MSVYFEHFFFTFLQTSSFIKGFSSFLAACQLVGQSMMGVLIVGMMANHQLMGQYVAHTYRLHTAAKLFADLDCYMFCRTLNC